MGVAAAVSFLVTTVLSILWPRFSDSVQLEHLEGPHRKCPPHLEEPMGLQDHLVTVLLLDGETAEESHERGH